MIIHKRCESFRLFTAMLLIQVVAAGVVVSLLDAEPVSIVETVDGSHDECECPVTHDHRICTQVASNHALGNAPLRIQNHLVRTGTVPTPPSADPSFEGPASTVHPRAPPRI